MKSIYKIYFYEKISKYSNLPHYDVCPVPSGNYYIKDFLFDMKMFKKFEDNLGVGSYRVDVFLVHIDVTVCGNLFYGSMTEKS